MRTAVDPDVSTYHRLWQSASALPSFLIGPDFKVLWRNPAFAALDASAPVREHDRALQFCDRMLHAAFTAYLAGVTTVPSAWVVRDDECGVLLVRCVRLEPDQMEPAVACVLHDSGNRSSIVWADFATAFTLTNAEATLARRLAEGELLAEAAAGVSITYETAKTHLRRIYAKLGVRGREEFYSRMLAYRVA
ncbi:helix-turn-helix transcriptional regulator [Brevundimonas sp. Root1279]|uniref:helix-turn-helix transcriptional regulator n=1 Tax=Brevundimonas sp. Root1279 TaxID=1736443 RepID=UPI0006F5011B|nr:helix-turn-helix transcriptional regulator [Brevundimonas sp. Root1279]KQW78747.1 hypothetical protein ASC65_15635 [Brevundimonas sp. Root1279]